eukprot:gi/632944116/ref/XP_007887323.1/ PREDICTED: NEDD4-binding protein 2 isoform X1 [Callorhinchus milii]
MDSLLLLSDAAEGVATRVASSADSSGFDFVAAALTDDEQDQVNEEGKMTFQTVPRDYINNSDSVAESVQRSGFDLTEDFDSIIENELATCFTNTTNKSSSEFHKQYQPFFNQYNSPMGQFSANHINDQFPRRVQSSLESAPTGLSNEQQNWQQIGPDDRLFLRQSPFTLNTNSLKDNSSPGFHGENHIFEQSSEAQSDCNHIGLDTPEGFSSKKSCVDSDQSNVFPNAIGSASIWPNQSESNSISRAIWMNIGAIGTKEYSGLEATPRQYVTQSNQMDHQNRFSWNNEISDQSGGNFYTDRNRFLYDLKHDNSATFENFDLFKKSQGIKGTNEIKATNNTISPSANAKNTSGHEQQSTSCFPYWFDVRQDSSTEKLSKLVTNEETDSPQHSNNSLFVNNSKLPSNVWNPWAPEFQAASSVKTFVTPVALSPLKPRPGFTSPRRPIGWTPGSGPPHLDNSRLIANNSQSKPWLNLHDHQRLQSSAQNTSRMTVGPAKLLFLLRGLPGSGKSTLARNLVGQGPNGIILSTDDYFCKNGQYEFAPCLIGEAHEWNQNRAKEAMEQGCSPVIIDNTNTQAWEMKPYIAVALKYNYKVVFREPNTWWKFKPRELEWRNTHGVPKEKIKAMLERYERHVTVGSVMRSLTPARIERTEYSLIRTEDFGVTNTEVQPSAIALRGAACQDLKRSSYAPVSPLTCMEDGKTVETEVMSSDNNLVKDMWQLADYTSESGNHKIGNDCDDNHGLSEFINGERLQKFNQTVRSAVSDSSDICSNVEMEAGTDERNIESEFNATENTDGLNGHGDITDSDITTTFSTIGQRIRRRSRQRSCDTEGVLEMPPVCGEDVSIVKKAQIVNKSIERTESELGNFVGDWPAVTIPKPQDQRERKTRKTECTNHEIGGQTNNEELINISNSIKEALNSSSEHENRERCCVLSGTIDYDESVDKLASNSNDSEIYSNEEASDSETKFENCEEPKCATALEQISERLLETHTNTKSRQGRRMGKVCKLALTFSGTSPVPAELPEQASMISDQIQNGTIPSENSRHCNGTQTAPEDFVTLWRIETQKAALVPFKVLTGTVDGFKSTYLNAIEKCVNPNQTVPYRVMYDKSTHVDESVFVNKEANLQILRDCFKSVPFEDLTDLYEKCNNDVEWTTNLLLDSGMKLSREDLLKQESAPPQELNQVSQTKNAKSDEQPPNEESTAVENMLPSASKKATDANLEMSETNEEEISSANNLPDHAEDFEDLNPSPNIETESEVVTELVDSRVVDVRNPTSDINCSQLPNPSNECTLRPELNEVLLRKESGNTECIDDKASDTSSIKLTKEADVGFPECAEIKEMNSENMNASQSNPEGCLNTQNVLSTESQFSSDTVEKENGNEEKEIGQEDESEKLNGLGMYADSLVIKSLELCLPPELAIQLNELFGSVGLDPDAMTLDDCVVQIDLSLAKMIHEKWKESILERQRQEALSYQLLLEDDNLSLDLKCQLEGAEEDPSSSLKQVAKTSGNQGNKAIVQPFTANHNVMQGLPFMDHWGSRAPSVSLRHIMSEEMNFQVKQDQSILSSLLPKKDCASKLKEKQLFDMFPGIDKHFIMDMYKDNNYSFNQTEQFLNSVLDCDPYPPRTVVAQDSSSQNEQSAERNKLKIKATKEKKVVQNEYLFQDIEYPDYVDFRAEASVHRRKQQECFSKAAEAHQRGLKEVATHYAQQGHLHGEKMKEANHRAAVRIFDQVNASLLPNNVLDLHGLHVNEALYHLKNVLLEKLHEHQQKGGKSFLSVITGRGNHSQGGVARLKPAVIEYLNSQNFRFKEPQPGVIHVLLK